MCEKKTFCHLKIISLPTWKPNLLHGDKLLLLCCSLPEDGEVVGVGTLYASVDRARSPALIEEYLGYCNATVNHPVHALEDKVQQQQQQQPRHTLLNWHESALLYTTQCRRPHRPPSINPPSPSRSPCSALSWSSLRLAAWMCRCTSRAGCSSARTPRVSSRRTGS